MEVAVFRFERIGDLVRLEPGSRQLRERLRERSEQRFDIPGSRRRRVSQSTLRRWMAIYRKDGLEGLQPRARRDRGRTRGLSPEVADALARVKEQDRSLPVRRVIRRVRREQRLGPEVRLAPSTVYRLLRERGLTRREQRSGEGRDLRRFSYAAAGELWQADVLHGPRVRCAADGRRRRKAYYIGTLDDATRLVPHAEFAFSESYEAFLPVFKSALLKRGRPDRLFTDNGAAYRSRHLRELCAGLGVRLLRGRPYHSEGRGKIERFHRTLRDQFLRPLAEPERLDLDELNRRLGLWLEGEYHCTPHRGLEGRRTPLDAWALTASGVRPAGSPEQLDELCRLRHGRTVSRDRVVQFRSRCYEVPGGLAGRKVVLLVDPAAPPQRPIPVEFEGRPAGLARPLDRVANSRVRRQPNVAARDAPGPRREPPPAPEATPAPLRLSDLPAGQQEDPS